MLDVLKSIRWQDVLDIFIVSFIIYRLFLLIRGTRAVQMLVGIAIIIIVYLAAKFLELLTLYWLLGTFLSSLFIIIIIIFQRDIRKALTQVGQTPFAKTGEDALSGVEEVVSAAVAMAQSQTGALMIIEREMGLKDYVESGYPLDAKATWPLLVSIFQTTAPMHDGGVIIRDGRILTAGCVLPLTRNPFISKRLGTRHRAAIGLSEETDAAIVVVSEETGTISLVQHGAITTDLDRNSLRSRLEAIFAPKKESHLTPWKSWLNKS
jgi:diadenylate cyclase